VGGSGSGGSYKFNPSDLAKLREEAKARLDQSRRDADVNDFLQHQLVDINERDTDLVEERLEGIEAALEGTLSEFDRVLFGGSVAKHTYVDGLSDIDSLVVLDPSSAVDATPAEVRHKVEESLLRRLNMSDVERIRVGDLAVTVKYKDGMEVQLLPAVERDKVISISSPDGKSWAPINPKEFADRLSSLNANQGNAVIPAIKLAKAIIAESFPQHGRPTGYHVEALAVAAFNSYEGPRTPKAMVQRFFDAASSGVLKPISDVTGQSRYVDDALGSAGSDARKAMAWSLNRIAKRILQSDSVGDWRQLLGE
jgi:predicted nucleotidyltransferase